MGGGVNALEQDVFLILYTKQYDPVCVCMSVCVGYIPRMTASRHLIGRDSLIISLAVSINLKEEEK